MKKENADQKDPKPKDLFVKDLKHAEGGTGSPGRQNPGSNPAQFTTLIVGEEGPDYGGRQ